MKRGVFVLTLVFVTCILAAGAWAECPAGKSEVQMTTPSGKVKFICIPDNAMEGLENAADHSDGTIVPSTCPCWDEADIKYYTENKIVESCEYDTYTNIMSCYDVYKKVSLEATKIKSCINYVTGEEHLLTTTEQWNACMALLPK